MISVGNAALTQPTDPTTEAARWLALGGGLVLAGTLWWLYFTSSADINQRILTASGGNPALAYTIYATGHLLPAFALLAIAAGINLSLHPTPPPPALWMLSGGLATVLVTTRAFAGLPRRSFTILLNTAGIAATAGLALLHHLLPPATVVGVIAGWAVGAAALATATRPSHTPPRHNPPPTSALS